MASSARDIPKPFGRDSFAAVAARSVPVYATKDSHPLPTPPNSISPSLPPHGLKARTSTANTPALDHVESDLDLHDGEPGSLSSQNGFDTAGAITPGLLAKHHLPDILLMNGPLAIRHIMGYLTTSVPGFSGIQPAKARRLVVGALEGRGSGGEGGGLNGDVRFEKVGWGRWDARMSGQPPRDVGKTRQSPPPSVPSSYSVGVPIQGSHSKVIRLNAPTSSWAGDSAVFSHDDDMDVNMLETEADKMSLDGDASYSSSDAPLEDETMEDDPDDITDDEDWAAVGAAALRQASYSGSGPGRNFPTSHVYTGGSRGGGGPSLSALAQSLPLQRQQQQHHKIDFSAFGMSSDAQEREAIEALLRLGSV